MATVNIQFAIMKLLNIDKYYSYVLFLFNNITYSYKKFDVEKIFPNAFVCAGNSSVTKLSNYHPIEAIVSLVCLV